MFKEILDFLFPEKCLGCGKMGNYYCGECKAKSIRVQSSGYFLSGFSYQGPIRTAIKKIKFKPYIFAGAESLVDFLLEDKEFLEKIPKNEAVLVPIPLHFWRENERGFNQAEILAKILIKKLNLPVVNLLERKILRKHQWSSTAAERRENIKNVFKIFKSQNCETVILVDDVWTTGATICEAARVLQEAGFKKIWAITLAR